jgi:hypothetical protein
MAFTKHIIWNGTDRFYLYGNQFCFSAIKQTPPNKRCDMILILLPYWSLQILD